MVLTFVSSAATASQVYITQGGSQIASGTLNSLSVASDGTVTVDIGGTTNTCTSTAPALTVTGIPSSITLGDTLTGMITTDATTVSANYGAATTTGWSWTPTSPGTYTITITAKISGQACNDTSIFQKSVTVNSSTTPPTTDPGAAINMGASSTWKSYSIPALGEQHYYLALDKNITSSLMLNMSSNDWATNQDIIMSPSVQPKCSDMTLRYDSGPTYWYGPVSSSNESVSIAGRYSAGKIFYVTICNRSNMTGAFQMKWTAN